MKLPYYIIRLKPLKFKVGDRVRRKFTDGTVLGIRYIDDIMVFFSKMGQ